MPSYYNSVAAHISQRKSNATEYLVDNDIRYLKLFNVTPAFKENFGDDQFICRLIWCHLKDLGGIGLGASTRAMEKEWGIWHKTLAHAIARLVDAGYVQRDGNGWKALDAPDMFLSSSFKLWRWKSGKKVAGKRWTIYVNAVWSLINSGLTKTSSISTVLCIDRSTVQRIYALLEKGGYLKMDQWAGHMPEVTPLPLNGHAETFIKSQKQKTEKSKPTIKAEKTEISDYHKEMVDRRWPNGGYLEWKNEKLMWQKQTKNGPGSAINYLEKCIKREYLETFPVRTLRMNLDKLHAALPFLSDDQGKDLWQSYRKTGKERGFPFHEKILAEAMLEAMIGLKPRDWDEVVRVTDRVWNGK